MIIMDKNLPVVVRRAVDDSLEQFKAFIKKVWVRVAFFLLIVMLISQKQFSVQFTIGGPSQEQQTASIISTPVRTVSNHSQQASLLPTTTNTNDKWWNVIKKESIQRPRLHPIGRLASNKQVKPHQAISSRKKHTTTKLASNEQACTQHAS